MIVHATLPTGLSEASSDEDEARVVEVLRAGPGPAPSHVRVAWAQGALSLLRSGRSRRVRDAAALALADLGVMEAVPVLSELLRRPDVAGSSGTLVYALDELGGRLPLSALLNLVENGSYEAQAEALTLVEDGRVEPDEVEEQEARARLSRLAQAEPPEVAEAARLALEHLDERATRGEPGLAAP